MPTETARLKRAQILEAAAAQGLDGYKRALDEALKRADEMRDAMDGDAHRISHLSPLLPSADAMRAIAEEAAEQAVNALRTDLADIKINLLSQKEKDDTRDRLAAAMALPTNVNTWVGYIVRGALLAIGGGAAAFLWPKLGGASK